MKRSGIFLSEANELVGPFNSREDAERFLMLMELFGTSSKGIDIVELEITTDQGCEDGVSALAMPATRPQQTRPAIVGSCGI